MAIKTVIAPRTQFRNLRVIRWDNGKYLCRCGCGRSTRVSSHKLLSGHTGSCGCQQTKAASQALITHGMSSSQEYGIWKTMINRCHRKTAVGYHQYGAKGVRVCRRWKNSFAHFIADMGRRPSPQHSLDRFPNRHGNYEPGNVRWATLKEQARNRDDNHWITIGNETLTMVDWSERSGTGYSHIKYRINVLGWSGEKAVTTPIRKYQKRPKHDHSK